MSAQTAYNTENLLSIPFIWENSNSRHQSACREVGICSYKNNNIEYFSFNGQFKLFMYFGICPMILIRDPVAVLTPQCSLQLCCETTEERKEIWQGECLCDYIKNKDT